MASEAAVIQRYDFVIVGSGATGGWAAKELAEKGHSVLVIEAGRAVDPKVDRPNRDYWWYGPEQVEAKYTDPNLAQRQPTQRQHVMYTPSNHHFFVDDLDNPYISTQQPFAWIRGRQEGGRTHVWGGQTWRLSDYELSPVCPDGVGSFDWPIRYSDIAPYYDEVECFLKVRGTLENSKEIPDGQFQPAWPITKAERDFKQYVTKKYGYSALTVRSVAFDAEPETDRHGQKWLRFSSQGSTMAAASATRNCSIRTNAVASHLVVDSESGRAISLSCVDALSKEPFLVEANNFILCASTIETTRLLLNSCVKNGNDNIFNASGMLGRYLSDHCGTWTSGILPRHYHVPKPEFDDIPFWNGYGIYIPRLANKTQQETDYFGGYGTGFQLGRRGMYHNMESNGIEHVPSHHRVFCFSFGEVLPRYESRVSLQLDKVDSCGIPIVSIDMRYGNNEEKLLLDAEKRIHEILRSFGCDLLGSGRVTPGLTVHEVGTARMGIDSGDSVVNGWGQTWGVPNVFCADGSTWRTSAYQNPTLTLMALALRTARYAHAHRR